MQQSVKPQQPGGNSQIHTIMITAITLFALSGAILGFAVGAFTHPRPTQITTNTSGTDKKPVPITKAKTPTPSPTATITNTQPLGCPDIVTSFNNLNGTTTINLIAKQKTVGTCGDPKTEANMTSDGITCRIFLAKAVDKHPAIDGSDVALFKDITRYSGTFPHEIAGIALSNGGSLTQPCMQGQASWTFTLSPTLDKGKYYIVGLTGNPAHYNYSWSAQLTK
ncbi:hypothetical protein [Dictyobacter kobayashii]|uniref:Uncharacterized protein n=1 Tax=Dictyobacter kobayashii TaxID=2014872 RepID=A0A402AM12_9CHLR|nr:hypothetical protein [Dictyobacter kobayashii]GCE20201.1 hypothetical protein KDK_40010 [Dictyobacter kobayashii]